MRLAFASLVALLAASPLAAQDYVPRAELGDLDARTQTDLDGNAVLATMFNFGQSGRTSATQGQIPYEWPAGSRQHYVALTGFFVGAEVVSETGEAAYIVDLPNYRVNPDDPGAAWTWAPVPEYLGGGEVARSDRPETWPAVWPDKLGDAGDPGWPGAWNGLLGKNAVIDGVETYVHYADDGYDRNRSAPSTTYVPDATDPDRAGLGVVVSERRLAFRDAPVEDVVFTVRDVYNAGTEDLDAVAATVWVADLVGGDADALDDVPVYDDVRRLVLFTDRDGLSPDPAFPAGTRVGAVALVLLEAPGDLAFTNVTHQPAGSVNFQSLPDELLYGGLMAPRAYVPPPPGDRDDDTFASVGLFPIPAETSVRVATALVFGEVDYASEDPETRYADLFAKAETARAFYAGGFVVAGEGGTPSGGSTLGIVPNPSAGAARIAFSLGAPGAARVEVFDRLGRRVALLAEGTFPAGTHAVTWGTRDGDGAAGVYLVRLTTPDGVQTRTVSVAR